MVQGLNSCQSKRVFSSPKYPDQPWGLLSLLFNGYLDSLPEVKQLQHEITTHLHLVQRIRMSDSIPQLPLYAYMMWTGKTSPSFTRKEIEIFYKIRSNYSNKYQHALNGNIYNHSLTQSVWKLLQCLQFLGCCSIVVSILLEYDSASMGNSLHTF
jgi:hypothetical protein